MRKLGALGEMSFWLLKMGELHETSYGLLKLSEFCEVSLKFLKLDKDWALIMTRALNKQTPEK